MTSDRPGPAPPVHDPLRVVVAGGGVAALEAVAALQGLAPGSVEVVLVADSDTYMSRPLLVGEPFGLGRPVRHELASLCAGLGAQLVRDRVCGVRPDEHVVETASGMDIIYDVLLVALGARPCPAFEHGVTFDRELSPEDFDDVLADLADGMAPRVAIIVPDGVSWSLPAYELALLTAAWAEASHPARSTVTLLTHEPTPVAAFGTRVGEAVADLLEAERVTLRCGVHPDVVTPTALRAGGHWLEADRIVSLPLLVGPRLPGLPADLQGFIRADGEGRVEGLADVYAAGDCTTFPIKQGGLAAQQAVAAVCAIAARAGADVTPHAFEPVLRAVLTTRLGPRYLRAELADVERTSTIASEPLWWPPSKIASRWLGPYLARTEQLAWAAPPWTTRRSPA